MKVNQIASTLNTVIVSCEIGKGFTDAGQTTYPIVAEDLTNIVDVGRAIIDYTSSSYGNFNKFVEGLIDQVGKVMFVDRTYSSQAPSIVHDSWEFGSIMQKVRAEVPKFQENTSWKLADIAADAIANSKVPGITDYDELDPFVLSIPTAQAKFYNSMVTFEAPITLTDMQLRSAFQSASELSAFIAMIENRIAMKMTLSTDALVMRTINNLIGLKIGLGENVVNLLTEYNSLVGAGNALTAKEAETSTEFLKYATKTMALYKDYLKKAGTLYNHGDYVTFTPADKLKFVALTDFAKNMETYLYADTFNREFVTLEGFSTVPSWQSVGLTGNDEATRSEVYVKATDGTNTYTIDQDGVVAVMFDRDAAAVCNENYRTTSQYNGRGEYTNYFYKYDSRFLNDIEENCVVFVIADYDAKGALPDAKPANWDTAYAIANSPFYVKKNGVWTHLTTSDASSAQGFDWDDYAGLQVGTKA